MFELLFHVFPVHRKSLVRRVVGLTVVWRSLKTNPTQMAQGVTASTPTRSITSVVTCQVRQCKHWISVTRLPQLVMFLWVTLTVVGAQLQNSEDSHLLTPSKMHWQKCKGYSREYPAHNLTPLFLSPPSPTPPPLPVMGLLWQVRRELTVYHE